MKEIVLILLTAHCFDFPSRPMSGADSSNALQTAVDPRQIIMKSSEACRRVRTIEYTEEQFNAQDERLPDLVATIRQARADVPPAGFMPGKFVVEGKMNNKGSSPQHLAYSYDGATLRIRVVGDVRYDSLTDQAEPTVYLPQPELTYGFMTFVIRTYRDPEAMAPAVRSELSAMDPDQPVSDVRTMEQVMAETVSRPRFNTLLFGLFAVLATLLAGVGIFGVMNHSVTLRTRELGIRMALGAQPGRVLMLILRQGLLLTLIGIGIGLAGALALTRVISGLLFGVEATDPVTFAAIVLLLAAVSLIACYIPARRATKVDPVIALRYE